MVLNSVVLPHIDNAYIFWGTYPNMVNNDRISKLQKRLARVTLRCKIREASSEELFNTMKLMPFYDRVTYKRCPLICKFNINLVPHYLQSVKHVTSVYNHNTRSAARGVLYTCNGHLKYCTRSIKI